MEEFKTQSDSIGKISAALTKFQAKMKGVKRTAENPYFHSKYAELSDVWDEIRGPLCENDLSIVQTFLSDANGVCLLTTLAHSSGEWFRGTLRISPNKPNDPQAQGSAITYARRYALQAITGIAPIDDDGNAGSGRGHQDYDQRPANERTATKPAPADSQVASAQKAFGDQYTASFKVSDPIKGKKGFYRKAMDREQNVFFVFDDPVIRDLQVAGDQLVTVKVDNVSGYPTIKEVLSKVA